MTSSLARRYAIAHRSAMTFAHPTAPAPLRRTAAWFNKIITAQRASRVAD